jgi:hypothetical protein
MATVGHRVDGSQLYRHLQIFVAAFRPQVGCWKVTWKHKMEIMSITTLGGCLAIEVRGKKGIILDTLHCITWWYPSRIRLGSFILTMNPPKMCRKWFPLDLRKWWALDQVSGWFRMYALFWLQFSSQTTFHGWYDNSQDSIVSGT